MHIASFGGPGGGFGGPGGGFGGGSGKPLKATSRTTKITTRATKTSYQLYAWELDTVCLSVSKVFLLVFA